MSKTRSKVDSAEPELTFEPGAISGELIEALVDEVIVPAMVKAERVRREKSGKKKTNLPDRG